MSTKEAFLFAFITSVSKAIKTGEIGNPHNHVIESITYIGEVDGVARFNVKEWVEASANPDRTICNLSAYDVMEKIANVFVFDASSSVLEHLPPPEQS